MQYLKRENVFFDTAEKRKFFDALRKCMKFANDEGIKLGSTRGSAPALLSIYALEYIERYPLAKKKGFHYNYLSSSINEYSNQIKE